MRKSFVYGAVLAFAHTATAQTPAASPLIGLELNAVKQEDATCQMTFVARSNYGSDISSLELETVFFNSDGAVTALTVLDFGDLPDESTRVRQFVLPDTQCAQIGQILFNGVKTCAQAGSTSCAASLSTSSRTAIEVLQ